jgi:hypothetical protein
MTQAYDPHADWAREDAAAVNSDHDESAARRGECYCETCTDRAAWYDQDRH